MPDQADTETPAESEPEAADTLIPGQNEAKPEPENGSVPAAEFNPSGNAGIIEQPEAGAMFQLYLSGAGKSLSLMWLKRPISAKRTRK